MRNKLIVLLIAVLAAVVVSPAMAAEDLVTQVQTGCATEIEQYCSNVTLGDGRLLACFFAHEDKLSSQCQYALYDASAQLERAVSALNYVAGECANDINTHCQGVKAGEGEILSCLDKNAESVSAGCTKAIDDVVERD